MNDRERALELAITSHPPVAGADHDRCFTARAEWFLEWLHADERPQPGHRIGTLDGPPLDAYTPLHEPPDEAVDDDEPPF